MQDINSELEKAIEKSKNWAHTGWDMTFGFNNTKVSSIKDSQLLSDTFSYKIESVAYWKQVDNAGQEAAQWGQRALNAYKKGNRKDVEDALYQAHYIEKFYEKYTNTWKPLIKAYEKECV